jgi:hypothetical protein
VNQNKEISGMKMWVGLVAGLSALCATQASAQSRDPLGPVLDNRCATSECQEATQHELPPVSERRPVDPVAANACYAANQKVGQLISGTSYYIQRHEISHGGVLTFDESTHIRNLLYSETYFIRETISQSDSAEQCNRLRDRAISVMKTIMDQNPVGAR